MNVRPDATDADLIAATRQGSEEAWGELVQRYRRLVFAVARSQRLTEDGCGEVFDGVFAELWRSLPQLQHPEQVRAWLVTVARRHSLAHQQHQRRWVSLSDPETPMVERPDPAPMVDAALVEAEREQAMRMALTRLSPRCRRLLDWLFFTDPPPSYEEIGRRLGVAGNSVGFIRSRCLGKLRAALQAELTPVGGLDNGAAPAGARRE